MTLTATRHQDFKLAAITDPEQRIRQLPPEMLAAALPEETEADANIKRIFHNQCTGCHTPGYPLQFKFDEAGWNKVINSDEDHSATSRAPTPRSNGIIKYNQKELAAYLARARGPGETSMKFKDRPRPTGEAARVMWTTYDVPLNPDVGIATAGSSTTPMTAPIGAWASPPASASCPMTAAWASTASSITPSTPPIRFVTIGKVNAKTGEVKYLKVDKR